MSGTVNEKLYIITLRFQNQEKRLYLVGEDSDSGQKKYKEAVEGIDAIGEKGKDFPEFLQSCIEHFQRYGFVRIKK